MAIEQSQLGELPPKPAPWHDPRIRSIAFQILTAALVIAFFVYIAHNAAVNLQRQGIASGFGFLNKPAGFGIQLSLIEYTEQSNNLRVFWVGLLNTILVAAIGIVLATLIGFLLGLARLSKNWLVARLATVYIETIRNIPVLLQILFWYFAVLGAMPHPRESIELFGLFYLNNGGLFMPKPILGEGDIWVLAAFVLAIVLVVLIYRWAEARRLATGQVFPILYVALALLIGLPLLTFLVLGVPLSFDYPAMGRFRLQGGVVVISELMALALALSIYTAAFIAEIVRSGIQSVARGQIEAAEALGLRPGTITRLVVIPQALRVIIPPLTSQYLNLTKNSSLAVAIGYPELVSVFAGTVLNQTGQAVEAIAMTMAVYLTLSLLISLGMNWYNRRMALVER